MTRNIHCPSCHAVVARHPWLVWKRARELTCPHCGAEIEVGVAAWPYYATTLAISLGTQIVAFISLFLLVTRNWSGVALTIAMVCMVDLARGQWLRRKATVRWINRESMERRASGRWVPE